MPLSFVSYESHGKAASDGGEKYGNRASAPAMERRLFLYLFTPFHLRFRYLLPVLQDNKVRGGIRRNGSKDLSQVNGRAVFVPEGETRPFRAP